MAAIQRYNDVKAASAFSQAFIGVVFAAVLGRVSDSAGRCRGIRYTYVPILAQQLAFAAWAFGGISLWPFLVLDGIPDLSWVLVNAYIADVRTPSHGYYSCQALPLIHALYCR